MGELYSTLLVRLALPAATLVAALMNFSALGLGYLIAFAALTYRPSYSLRKHYPAPALAVLASFSIGLLVVQVTLSSLIAAGRLTPTEEGLWAHLDDVGVARFDRGIWDGLRCVLGPALVTSVSLLCLLAEERRSRRSFMYVMFHRGGASLADRHPSTRLRLRQTRSLVEAALVTVDDAPARHHVSVPGIGNAVATRGSARISRYNPFPWAGRVSADAVGGRGSRGLSGASGASSTSLDTDVASATPDGLGVRVPSGSSLPDGVPADGMDGTGFDAYDGSGISLAHGLAGGGVDAEIPSRLTRFMAGTGGVFWTAVSLAATGTAVSSVANSFFTAVLFFIVLSWGFGWEGVRPAVAPSRVLRGLAALRVTLLLYIFALVAFQLTWLDGVRDLPVVVLMGVRPLRTAGQPQGWTHIMALGGALFCYVVTGLFAKAVRGAYVTRTRWAALLVEENETVAPSLSRPSSFLSSDELSAEGAGLNGNGSSPGSFVGVASSATSSPSGSGNKAYVGAAAAAAAEGSRAGPSGYPSHRGPPPGVAPRATSAPLRASGAKPPRPPGGSRSRSVPEWGVAEGAASSASSAAVAAADSASAAAGEPRWKGSERSPHVDRVRSPFDGVSAPVRQASAGLSGRSWTGSALSGASGLTPQSGRDTDELSSRRLGSALTASTRFGLSAKEFLLLRSLLHLASVALMVWVLVLPGFLTLPLLFLAFLYLTFKRCRNSRVLDYAVYYVMGLQLVHAVYVAVLVAWGLPESTTADALGFRVVSAPVIPAIIEVATIALIALSIYLKEYLKTVRVWEPRRDGGQALMGNVTEQELLEMMLSHREYSAVAKGTFSPFKVILDQVALAALYVAGASAATALNAVFIISLTAICVTQVVPLMDKYKRRLIAVVWVSIFVYSMAFMATTSVVCRIGSGSTFNCTSLGTSAADTVGVRAADTLPVLAYTLLVVCASIQVHFTWPWRSDTDAVAQLQELTSAFWSFLRRYFLYVAYAALLLYPLVSPANFLSYGYLLLLLLCFLVEILFRFQTSRRVLSRLWLAVVLFACLGLIARYLVRFDRIEMAENQAKLVFGVGAGMSGFVLTLGDAAILIVISLQGRLFLQPNQLAANSSLLPSVSPSQSPGLVSRSARPPSAGAAVPRPPSGVSGASDASAASGVPAQRPSVGTSPAGPSRPRPPTLTSEAGGSGVKEPSVDKAGGFAPTPTGTTPGSVRGKSAFESPALGRLDSSASLRTSADFVGLPDVSTRAKLLDAKRFLLRVRNSLPVVQTRDALKWLYVRLRQALQQLLFPYSSILPSSAIVAAAIWLDGITFFGAVYVLLGCLIVCLDNRPAISRRSDAVIPLALRVLSPLLLLMSFSCMTLQYLYLVLSLQQGSAFVELQSGSWGPMVAWIGLQYDPATQDGTLFLPIGQDAMLAHCLVFVTAFLQRATLRWASSLFKQGDAGGRGGTAGALARSPSGASIGDGCDERLRAGLLSARPISDVFSGLALDERLGVARRLSAEPESADGGKVGDMEEAYSPLPVASSPGPSSGGRAAGDPYHDSGEAGGSAPPVDSDGGSSGVSPANPFSRRAQYLTGSHVHFASSSPRPLGPGSPEPVSGVLHDKVGASAVSHGSYGVDASDYALHSMGGGTAVDLPSPEHQTTRLLLWIGRSLLLLGRRLGDVLSLLQPFWASWGFDMTYVVLVVGSAISRTVFSLVHIVFVLSVCLIPRRTMARLWVACTLFLVALVLLQYGLSLGLPPVVSWSWKLRDQLPEVWQAWLYIDESNSSRKRKTDITIAFIAVICAGTTLNAIPPRLSLNRCGQCTSCVPNGRWSLGRLFGQVSFPGAPPCTSASSSSSAGKENGLAAAAAATAEAGGTGQGTPLTQVAVGVNSSASALSGIRPPGTSPAAGAETTTCFGENGDGADLPFKRCFAFAAGASAPPRVPAVDFTQRPLAFANAVKLAWMRFAGSAVQLYLFAVASVDPSVFSAVLLGLAFYFFFQFTNVAARRARFVIVRLYVLAFVLAVVAYQAPFKPPSDEDRITWARVLGLYKLRGPTASFDPGVALLGLLVSLWILSQMQGRIYESDNFHFVLRNMKEDEVLRFRRAVHDHQDRVTERMLASNELERNKSARAARLERLQELKNTTRSVDAFFNVCVVQEAELAAKNEQAAPPPEFQFAPRLSFTAAFAVAAADEPRLSRYSRTPGGTTPYPPFRDSKGGGTSAGGGGALATRPSGLRFRRPDGTFSMPGPGGGLSKDGSGDRVVGGRRWALEATTGAGSGRRDSMASFTTDVTTGREPASMAASQLAVDAASLAAASRDHGTGVDWSTAAAAGSSSSAFDASREPGSAGPAGGDSPPVVHSLEEEDFPWWNRMLRAACRGVRWQSHLHHSLRHELRFFVTRYSAWPVYLSMLLAVTVSPTLSAVLYPLVLFLYLLVEQPRPPKSAWIALLLYVEMVITFKFVARKFASPSVRFFVSDYSDAGKITQWNLSVQAGGVFFDILILVALLWHRRILYYRGLWDLTGAEERLLLRPKVTAHAVDTPDDAAVINEPSVVPPMDVVSAEQQLAEADAVIGINALRLEELGCFEDERAPSNGASSSRASGGAAYGNSKGVPDSALPGDAQPTRPAMTVDEDSTLDDACFVTDAVHLQQARSDDLDIPEPDPHRPVRVLSMDVLDTDAAPDVAGSSSSRQSTSREPSTALPPRKRSRSRVAEEPLPASVRSVDAADRGQRAPMRPFSSVKSLPKLDIPELLEDNSSKPVERPSGRASFLGKSSSRGAAAPGASQPLLGNAAASLDLSRRGSQLRSCRSMTLRTLDEDEDSRTSVLSSKRSVRHTFAGGVIGGLIGEDADMEDTTIADDDLGIAGGALLSDDDDDVYSGVGSMRSKRSRRGTTPSGFPGLGRRRSSRIPAVPLSKRRPTEERIDDSLGELPSSPSRAELFSDAQLDGEFLGGGAAARRRPPSAVEAPSSSSPMALLSAAGQGVFSPIVMHYQRLLRTHTHKAVGDYYLVTFACDFMAFVYLIFGYSYMFEPRNDFQRVSTWWTTNFVVTQQLVVVIAAFFALVLDRVIYLRRSMMGKLLMQYASVLLYHYFVFVHAEFGQRQSLRVFYVLKCVYFLVSGLQIRYGFPLYTTGQWLLRNFSLKGLIAFHIYYNVPFLWLTRTLLDWAVLPTSLEIFQYFKFIDVYIYLYQNAAINASRGWFKRMLGQKRPIVPRIFQGGGLFLLCALLLFLPFFLFSLVNPLFRSRELVSATYSVDLLLPGNRDSVSLYSRFTTATTQLSEDTVDVVDQHFGLSIQQRSREQLYRVFFDAPSVSMWSPPPTTFDRLNSSLLEFVVAPGAPPPFNVNDRDAWPKLRFGLTGADSEETYTASMEEQLTLTQSRALATAVANLSSAALELPLNVNAPKAGSLSRYMTLVAASSLFQPAVGGRSGVCLRFHSVLLDAAPVAVPDAPTTPSTSALLARRSLWWSVTDCVRNRNLATCSCLPPRADGSIIGVDTDTFSTSDDTDNPFGLTYILQISDVARIAVGGGTILTLYAVVLFSVAQLAKSWFSNKRLIIPVTDMPYTQHLFTLVSDIVYARQDGRLDMEEVLFNGLMDIYRDPHVMVRWTGERKLKTPTIWWQGEGAVDVYPSYRETATEPYVKSKQD